MPVRPRWRAIPGATGRFAGAAGALTPCQALAPPELLTKGWACEAVLWVAQRLPLHPFSHYRSSGVPFPSLVLALLIGVAGLVPAQRISRLRAQALAGTAGRSPVADDPWPQRKPAAGTPRLDTLRWTNNLALPSGWDCLGTLISSEPAGRKVSAGASNGSDGKTDSCATSQPACNSALRVQLLYSLQDSFEALVTSHRRSERPMPPALTSGGNSDPAATLRSRICRAVRRWRCRRQSAKLQPSRQYEEAAGSNNRLRGDPAALTLEHGGEKILNTTSASTSATSWDVSSAAG